VKSKFSINKLRNRIWIYFVIFTVLLVFLIWLLQTVFFEYNYQSVRGTTMNLYADLIVTDIQEGDTISDEYLTNLNDSDI